ncbi:uncharacterized protein BDCG_16264 [Blastomyces dermatitidis ER-3]|uniref:Uncharacterized protein n=1 Tax=Ajellomyces dermatitidis (strain ER-3 / ATCC MYA-2586) TaxID=559297 RepID=A0ABX2VSW1_AJEDR|nr:uncharacterized protein BDCG_16264 [Blastomyces dermatitidis ER-3]OAS99687.1 hypothetical protein BDCG_16264 [Blastomyces dermatitidis ER-3]
MIDQGGNREWPRIGAYVESVKCNGIVYMIDRGGGRGSAIENGRGSAIENGRGSAIENGRGSAIENGRGSAIENGRGSECM